MTIALPHVSRPDDPQTPFDAFANAIAILRLKRALPKNERAGVSQSAA